MTRDWGRLMTAMLTPFSADGSVNFSEAARIAKYLVDEQQNDALVVNGTTGESPTLTESEKLHLLEMTLETVGDRAAVIFGAGSYATAESIHMTREGTRLGAHGIMLVNPYYNRPGQDGLYAHFRAASEATDLPVMLYNIQPRSAINLETATLMRLISDVPNIVAVKEASGNLAQISEVIGLAPEGFRVYSGDDGLTLAVMALGGHGLVSVAAHVIGRELKELITSFEKDPARARQIHHSLAPVIRELFANPSPVPVKVALAARGFDCESVRLPLVELSPNSKSKLLKVTESFT
ncbi:MAG: 4-hydroxy-tetrahydrodipicolinate synthase [Armatimonadetes bacterium]|nr:4-hydroxy-tetrahydrodipicolinate synthase [Armatimonadota bacterium]